MITKDVRVWLDKVKRKEYSYNDALYELSNLIPFLTKDELKLIKKKIQDCY